jgi:thiamine transport system ATP-binding protein
MTRVPPHERRFGLMFQDYALFPHRDVAANVSFGLRMTGVKGEAQRARVADVLALVGLSGFEPRSVSTLSGGEQQRVALARALAPQPRLLMLDEPLGALDRDLRDRLLDDLATILEDTAVPALYVTHDHDEAFAIADRIAVMRAGRLVQTDEPETLWSRPLDLWTATFLGFGPPVDGIVRSGSVHTPWGDLPALPDSAEGPAVVVLRPDAVRIAADERGALRGRVERVEFRGERRIATVRAGAGPPLSISVDRRLGPGLEVALAVDPDGVLLYPG